MNVSSVKNLNGEVLSAVQDASLTNVIQTNSGNWQDITAYQNASATYLTEFSIPESAVWQDVSTTVQTNSAQWAEGGGDVPTGTMNVSGLEYNAVNEISAYNGSAIAQYGAEKQWLVHDDTLVHASNSAQYALGVNLSAVAQLLGVDETILYSASTSESVIHLSEPLSNFKEVKVDYKAWERVERKTIPTDNLYGISLQNGIIWGQGSGPEFYNLVFNYEMNSNFDTISALAIRRYSTNTANAWSNVLVSPGLVGIVKVIGIGRKQ